MNKKLLIIVICMVVSLANAAPRKYKYYIQFKDKNNSPYSLSNPGAFLSQKAIDRRTRQNIQYKENDLPVNPAYVSAIQNMGAKILLRSRWFNAITTDTIDSITLNNIMALSFVKNNKAVALKKAENNTPVEEKFLAKPERIASSSSAKKSATSYNYGPSFNQIHMMNGDILHENGFRGNGMTIAILDAGFYHANILPAFDSLWANNQILGMHDFVEGGTSVFEDNEHGMWVLSSMGGNIPGQLIGTAPKASYWLLRSEQEQGENLIEEANWVSAAEFADSVGADIINSSLGYTEFDNNSFFHNDHTYADLNGHTALATNGADIAASKGILVVNSAGNSGAEAWHYIGVPSDGDSVLCIGAVNPNRTSTVFSSRGPSSDGRVKPNVSAQGSQCVLQDSDNKGLTYRAGTSFSSPITAGMCACLWQAKPTLTNMEVFHAVENSASLYPAHNDSLGYGIPDFLKAYGNVTGIQLYSHVSKDAIVDVYPNPSTGITYLKIDLSDSSQNVRIDVYDVYGKLLSTENKLYSMGTFTHPLDLSSYASGIYFVKLTTNNDILSAKMIRE